MRRVIKVIVVILGCAPGALLAYAYVTGKLPSPWRTIVQESGLWAMRFLTLGLLVTPLRIVSGWGWPQPLRRTIGHLAAGYTALHAFAWTRQFGYEWDYLLDEAWVRLYLNFGVIATLTMIPLSATSFDAAMRRLGGRAWRRLHWLVYPTVGLAWLHYWLSRGVTPAEARWQGALLIVAMLIRVMKWTHDARR